MEYTLAYKIIREIPVYPDNISSHQICRNLGLRTTTYVAGYLGADYPIAEDDKGHFSFLEARQKQQFLREYRKSLKRGVKKEC